MRSRLVIPPINPMLRQAILRRAYQGRIWSVHTGPRHFLGKMDLLSAQQMTRSFSQPITSPTKLSREEVFAIFVAFASPALLLLLFLIHTGYGAVRNSLEWFQLVGQALKENSLAKTLKQPDLSPSAYTQLTADEFRLLVIEPGFGAEEIRCRLCICKNSESVSYRALSYAWGDATKVREVRCNGHVIPIGLNLHEALIHLRHRRYERIIWVDALCINQGDFDERGHQVRNMRNIYAKAEEVLVWLGKADSSSTKVSRSLDQGTWRSYIQSPPWQWDIVHYDFPESREERRDLAPLSDFLEKPWFRRLWVLQEVALAKQVTLIAGDIRISWENFAFIVQAIHQEELSRLVFSKRARAGANAVVEMQSTRRAMQPLPNCFSWHRHPLLSVLLATSEGECSDVRDRVYAVLALADDYDFERDIESFGPDYHLSPQEAYIKLARWYIARRNLDILSCVAKREAVHQKTMKGLPSWVPDWTRIRNDDPFILHGDRLPFNAGIGAEGLSLGAPEVTKDNRLILSGVIVDTVKDFEPFPSSLFHGPEVTLLSLRYERWVRDLYLKNPICGIGPQRLARSFNDRLLLATGLEEYTSDSEAQRGRIRDVRHRIRAHVTSIFLKWPSKRRIAVSGRGTPALVPEGTQKGDIIVVVAGAKVPLIFRKSGVGAEESYITLGEAFVDEVMDGWFLRSLIKDQARLGGQPHGHALRKFTIV